jgi:hypothetical protein
VKVRVLVSVLFILPIGLAITSPRAHASGLSIRVVGNHLVDGAGQTVRLIGSTRPGSVYTCKSNGYFTEGPWDQAAVDAMASWHFNAVRIPLNEDCWLGINGLPIAGGDLHGSAALYRADVHEFVAEIERDGMYPILDNRDAAPGTQQPILTAEMPDADHAPTFMASLAASFSGDPAVIFDLYNEPNHIPGTSQQQMACVRDGCAITDPQMGTYQSAGEQSLLDAVRGAGATQVVLESAPTYASDFRYWLQYTLNDPLGQVAASAHPYQAQYWLNTPAEWDAYLGPVLQRHPVVATELGERGCGYTYTDSFMSWADLHGVSYMPFGWIVWGGCDVSLISDYSGTPTSYGIGVRDHIAALFQWGPVAKNRVNNRGGTQWHTFVLVLNPLTYAEPLSAVLMDRLLDRASVSLNRWMRAR